MGRQRPITRSRPDGRGQSEKANRASARMLSAAPSFAANWTSALAVAGVPTRRLALITRRTRGSRISALTFASSVGELRSEANSSIAPLMGWSLIARAASITRSGSESCRKVAISDRSSRRIARSEPIRTAGAGSLAAVRRESKSLIQVSAIMPAWRRYGSASPFSRSMASTGATASRRPNLPMLRAAKKRTRGLASVKSASKPA